MTSLISMILQENYTLMNLLGEGTFGAVRSAVNDETKQNVAIKQIYVQRGLVDDAMSEVNNLKDLLNDHIISYKHSFYDSQEFYLCLVMQLCKDSLRGQMKSHKVFQNRQLESFLLQMTSAFLHLERKKIMHLDLKPENILIANQKGDYFKLCDFGCSQVSKFSRMSGYEKNAFGTFNYLAPEMHFNYTGEKSRSSADMWSLGVTLYEMIFWKLPFSKESNGMVSRTQIESFFNGSQQFAINYQGAAQAPKEIINVIKEMLKPLPIKRITWKLLKEYLIKHLKVQEHQFLDIHDLIQNFTKIFQLLIRTAKNAKELIFKGNTPFIKSNQKYLVQMFQQFVHYIYIIGLKFRQRQSYRWQILSAFERQDAEKLMKASYDMEKQVCSRKQIKMFSSSDFDYQQCVMLDQMKYFKEKIGKQSSEFKLTHTVFQVIITIISRSEGIFTKISSFEKCFKI